MRVRKASRKVCPQLALLPLPWSFAGAHSFASEAQKADVAPETLGLLLPPFFEQKKVSYKHACLILLARGNVIMFM